MNNVNQLQNQTDQISTTATPSKFWTVFLLGLFLGVFGVHRFYAGKIKSGLVQLFTCGGLGVWAFIDVIFILMGKFRNSKGMIFTNPKPKVAWGIFAAVVVLGLIASAGDKGTGGSGTTVANSGSGGNDSVDPDPTGTWTSGDKNSVYSRLTVESSGTFEFETVDFTGDVKGGYSGTWKMNGKSIRFEWGSGVADSGSCSGRKTGRGSLVFGSTTFHK